MDTKNTPHESASDATSTCTVNPSKKEVLDDDVSLQREIIDAQIKYGRYYIITDPPMHDVNRLYLNTKGFYQQGNHFTFMGKKYKAKESTTSVKGSQDGHNIICLIFVGIILGIIGTCVLFLGFNHISITVHPIK